METKQTLKEVMALWKDAMTSYNAGQSEKCLELYFKVTDKSGRIYYNMGCANIRLKRDPEALWCFTKAVEKDPHLAISFFQRGVLLLEARRLDYAMSDFLTTRNLLRGNTFINYKQLGLLCKLHLCEVLYNMALICVCKGNLDKAEQLLKECQHETEYKHRKKISTALEYIKGRIETSDFLKPMTISADLTFTPPKDVIENLDKKHVMGKAKVVSATDVNDSDPSFNGPKRVEELRSSGLQTPTSPLTAMKRFLKNPAAKRDRSKSQCALIGQIGMKGSQSMMDLSIRRKSDSILADSMSPGKFKGQKMNSALDMHRSTSALQLKGNTADKNVSYRRERRISLGSIFGNNMSPVNTALSKSFDVLSAVVAPIAGLNIGGRFSPIGLNHEHLSDSSDEMLDQIDEGVSDVFIDCEEPVRSLHSKMKSDKIENESVDQEKKKNIFYFPDTSEATLKKCASDPELETMSDESKGDDRQTESKSPRRRKIPPPPSYPPPPLPPDVVITL